MQSIKINSFQCYSKVIQVMLKSFQSRQSHSKVIICSHLKVIIVISKSSKTFQSCSNLIQKSSEGRPELNNPEFILAISQSSKSFQSHSKVIQISFPIFQKFFRTHSELIQNSFQSHSKVIKVIKSHQKVIQKSSKSHQKVISLSLRNWPRFQRTKF